MKVALLCTPNCIAAAPLVLAQLHKLHDYLGDLGALSVRIGLHGQLGVTLCAYAKIHGLPYEVIEPSQAHGAAFEGWQQAVKNSYAYQCATLPAGAARADQYVKLVTSGTEVAMLLASDTALAAQYWKRLCGMERVWLCL